MWFLDDVRCLGSQPASYGSDFNIAELQSNCIYHMIIYVRSQQLVWVTCILESNKIKYVLKIQRKRQTELTRNHIKVSCLPLKPLTPERNRC